MPTSTYVIPVTTTGSAGSATGSATSELIKGYLVDVYIDYHASAPATTDVTIAYAVRGGNLLAVTNNATDGLYHPRATTVDNTNAATGAPSPFLLDQGVTVSVAQADALDPCVTVYLRVDRP